MSVSGVVPTVNGEKRLAKVLARLGDLCDEIVVLIDKKTTDDSYAVARHYTDNIFSFEHDELFRNIELAVFERARCDWILHLADDETAPRQWTRSVVEEMMANHEVTHYLSPTRWLVPPGDRYITTGRWWPNYIPHFYRNIESLAMWGTTPHDIFSMAGEGAHVSELPIDHWNLVLKSRAEREERAEHYREMDPANPCVELYLFEERRYETEERTEQAVDRLGSFHDGSPSDSPYCVDIAITDSRRRMIAGEDYAMRIEVTNRTSRVLRAPRAYLEPTNIFLANHWYTGGRSDLAVHDFGSRQIPMPATLRPMERRSYLLALTAPTIPGKYQLQFDVVEQGVAWFSQSYGAGFHEIVEVEVLSS